MVVANLWHFPISFKSSFCGYHCVCNLVRKLVSDLKNNSSLVLEIKNLFLDGIIGFAFRNLDVSRVDTRLFCIKFI